MGSSNRTREAGGNSDQLAASTALEPVMAASHPLGSAAGCSPMTRRSTHNRARSIAWPWVPRVTASRNSVQPASADVRTTTAQAVRRMSLAALAPWLIPELINDIRAVRSPRNGSRVTATSGVFGASASSTAAATVAGSAGSLSRMAHASSFRPAAAAARTSATVA